MLKVVVPVELTKVNKKFSIKRKRNVYIRNFNKTVTPTTISLSPNTIETVYK